MNMNTYLIYDIYSGNYTDYDLFINSGKYTNNDLFIDTVLLFISSFWFSFFTIVICKYIQNLICFILFGKNNVIEKEAVDKTLVGNNVIEKEVIIVRGISGIGKDSYVHYNELDKKGLFATVSSDDYFYNKNDEYIFDIKCISKSNAYCLDKFHIYLQSKVPRIYLTNVNNKIWMYSNFINIAKSYKYNVKIVEIVCDSIDYLKYFNFRSKHNVPITFSKKTYNEWEYDNESKRYQAYIGNRKGPLIGDSIPYPKLTEKFLNNELDEYIKNKPKCLIQSSSESDSDISDYGIEISDSESCYFDSDSNSNYSDSDNYLVDKKINEYPNKIIPFISSKTKKLVLKRQIKILQKINYNDKLSCNNFIVIPKTTKYIINK